MSTFINDLGGFFQGLGEGVVSTVQGVGSSFEAQAAYNQAVAQQMLANAAATQQQLQLQAEQQKRQQQTIIIVFLIVFLAPVIILGLYFAFKK